MSTINATGYNDFLVTQLGTMRTRLDGLTQQLSTGVQSPTYGGLGTDRDLTLSYQSKLKRVETFQQTISTLDVRMQIGNTTLSQLSDLTTKLRGNLDPNSFNLSTTGVTDAQTYAADTLDAFTALLNTDVAGHYLFSGAAADTKPVVDVSQFVDGANGKAGLKQVMAERLQADQGSDGRGRLTLSSGGGTVTVAEDGAHGFGMKLSTVTSSSTAATVVGPSGSPASLSVTFSTLPTNGDKITFVFDQPDGTSSTIELAAGDSTDASAGTFQIGATAAETADNLKTVLDQKIQTLAKTDLVAASAMQAGNDFFATENGGAPLRVDGPPFDTATTLSADTSYANTVRWYKGTNDASSARGDATARVDTSVTVSYGLRANEQAFSWAIRQMAVLSTVDVSGGSATDQEVHSQLVQRAKANLGGKDGVQSLATVLVEFGSASQAASQAETRHTAMAATYQKVVDSTLNADPTEVSAQILQLQTQMQASYQATSILYKLSLTNYI